MVLTGKYHTHFRDYDPLHCKWLSRDPIAEAGGVNLTGYCGNNPLGGVDELGLFERRYSADGRTMLVLSGGWVTAKYTRDADGEWRQVSRREGGYDTSYITVTDVGMMASQGAQGILKTPWNVAKGAYEGVAGLGELAGSFAVDPSGTMEGLKAGIRNMPQAVWDAAADPEKVAGFTTEVIAGVQIARALKAAKTAKLASQVGRAEKVTDIGLSGRGYRPGMGERSMTRGQWKAAYRAERVAAGKQPSWPTARRNIFKKIGASELENPSGRFSQRNIARMMAGKAPQIRARILYKGRSLTRDISMEYHHKFFTQRSGARLMHERWNIELVMPWAHAGMDRSRHIGYVIERILRGPTSF